MFHRLSSVIPRRTTRLIKFLLPESWFVARTLRSWKREEPSIWPLPEKSQRSGLERYEYSLLSQNGEDGILRFLFSKIGFASRRSLEFGFGASQCNSLRLILHEGFSGVLIDGDESNVARFNKSVQRRGITNSRAVHRFLTLDNIENTIGDCGLANEVDLLVIDVDGNDYWFWDGINCVTPRIVVIEYNASLGSNLSLTVPYDPTFQRLEKHPSGMYCGASLTALARLGARKGYSLVGCESRGVNAFFVRNDCLPPDIESVTPQAAYRPHLSRLQRGYSEEYQYQLIKDLPYVEIRE